MKKILSYAERFVVLYTHRYISILIRAKVSQYVILDGNSLPTKVNIKTPLVNNVRKNSLS